MAIPTAEGPEMRPIVKLLPDAYFYPDAKTQRVIRFNKHYYEAVAKRIKTTSVRWDESVAVGPVIFYFEDDDRPPLRGEFLAVNSYGLDELTPTTASAIGRRQRRRLCRWSSEALPGHPADARIDVVGFVVY